MTDETTPNAFKEMGGEVKESCNVADKERRPNQGKSI